MWTWRAIHLDSRPIGGGDTFVSLLSGRKLHLEGTGLWRGSRARLVHTVASTYLQ